MVSPGALTDATILAHCPDASMRHWRRTGRAIGTGARDQYSRSTSRKIRARIAVEDSEVEKMRSEINAILAFVEQLSEVDVEGVEPMTSVTPMVMKKRTDDVTDGGIPDMIVGNAPATVDHFFLVPKVVE